MAGSGEEGHASGLVGAVPAVYRHLVVDRGNETAALRTESFVSELKSPGVIHNDVCGGLSPER